MNRTSRMSVSAICVITLLCLAGCATPFDRLKNYKGPDSGTLLLSLGQNRESVGFGSAGLSGRLIGSADLFELKYAQVRGRDAELDLPVKGGWGMLIARKLPPGDYEIDGAHHSFSGFQDEIRTSGTFAAPVRFSIKAGTTTYIGSYLVAKRSRVPAKPYQSGGVVVTYEEDMYITAEASDERGRDMSIAMRRHPQLNDGPVLIYLPSSAMSK